MAIDWNKLRNASRLLMETELTPIQGSRFQPTGFPDLGAATFELPNNNGNPIRMLLVESAQSMANRLESVSWNEAEGSLQQPLAGMPYVLVNLWDSGQTTTSILEAHRLNSHYVMNDDDFKEKFRTMADIPQRGRAKRSESEGDDGDTGGAGLFDRRKLAEAAFRYDPCSVLHGIFLEKLNGRARLQRCVSAFIEAKNVQIADSGGVKNDHVSPQPSRLREIIGRNVSAADGLGNVPFRRLLFAELRRRLKLWNAGD